MMTEPSAQPPHRTPFVTLSPGDAAALDALLETRGPRASSESIPPVDPQRLARAQQWLNVLAAASVPTPAPDLLQRTLDRVDADRFKLDPATQSSPAATDRNRPRSWWSRHLGEFAAMGVAASLLGAVVALGIFQSRNAANRVACASNIAAISNAFATYAVANNNQLPNLGASPDGNWLRPTLGLPNSHSNADNLLPLLNANLIHPANLVCPGRNVSLESPSKPGAPLLPDNARGYSYANLFAAAHPHWDGAHTTLILADRNPLFDTRAANDPQSNSANHRSQGTYVLHADGAVTWETSPNIGPAHDNIWTIGAGPQYAIAFTGTETPATTQDIFLAP